jgi:shikimate kinase
VVTGPTGAAPSGRSAWRGMGQGPLVVLMGPPGAGKSTVAAHLSTLLDVPTVDTDDRVVAAAGMSIPDIFLEYGEEHFRHLEQLQVEHALGEDHIVLALGGGAVLHPVTQELLIGRSVVFLDVTARAAIKRTGIDHGRPLLGLNPRASMIRLMEERRPIYERLATFRIDTSERTPLQVADAIVDELGLLRRDGA